MRFLFETLFALAVTVNSAQAQQAKPTPAPMAGVTFSDIKSALSPLLDIIAFPFWAIANFWTYTINHPPIGVMISTVIAGTIAIVSIWQQRVTTRLRETFNTINSDNWDEDIIKARQELTKIKQSHPGVKIADFVTATDENISARATLQNILNDYENMALGVRMNILDEGYLIRWMRSSVINDWKLLSPLVSAYRSEYGNPNLYVEFEGLSLAWSENKSYRTKRKLRPASRYVKIR